MSVKSLKGATVNMAALIAQNETAIAVGNGKMNARGDRVDRQGNVIQPVAAKEAAYNTVNPKAVKPKQISIKDLGDDFFESPADAVKRLQGKPTDKEAVAKPATKRKIVEE